MTEDTQARKRQIGRLRIAENPDWTHVEAWVAERQADLRVKLEDDGTTGRETRRIRARLGEWRMFREAFNAESLRNGLSGD